jgi:ubiquinol-cytochrome c reductase cytochrome b/c1 subunit
VITNLFSSLDSIISGLGTTIVQWIWGGFSVDNPTLNRLFSLHYLFPFVIAGLVALHIWALHIPNSNNPTGVEVKNEEKETLPFHPYFTTKDLLAMAVFGLFFAYFVFYTPNYLGDAANYEQADQLRTPPHIVPEWYFLPFYAILRAIPSKLGGVIAMFGSLFILFVVPWLDTSKVKSARYRPIYFWFFWALVFDCLALGYLGSQPPEGSALIFARLFTLYYFAHFLLVMPILGQIEKPRVQPAAIADTFRHQAKKDSDRKISPIPAE